MLDLILVLTICILFRLETNIINYLWFSTLGLIVYYLGSLYGWLLFLFSFQLGFYFYLYGLELHLMFSAFSKLFYLGCLLYVNLIGREFYFLLGYVLIVYGVLNYMLIGRIYFFSFLLSGQYFFSFIMCLLYLLSFHEFSLFSLIIGFPLSLIFYLKLRLLYLRCYYIFCLFLFPVLISIHIGSFPLIEEIFISLCLLLVFF